MGRFAEVRLLLVTIVVLAGLAGCAGAAGGLADDTPDTRRSGSTPVQTASRSGSPGTAASASVAASKSASATTPGVGSGQASPAERRSRLLGALREAGLPVSETGDREVRAAELACGLVKRGADADDLARQFTERYPVIPETKARELAQIVISTYC